MRQAAELKKTTIRKKEEETDAEVSLLFTPLFNIYRLSWAIYLDNYDRGGGCRECPNAEERQGQAWWYMMRSTHQAQARGSQVWVSLGYVVRLYQRKECTSEQLTYQSPGLSSKHQLQTQLQIPVWKRVETEQRRVRDLTHSQSLKTSIAAISRVRTISSFLKNTNTIQTHNTN